QPPEAVPDGLTLLPLPTGQAAEEVHVGTYETLRTTYDAVFAEIARRGLVPADLMWEEYLTDPSAGVPPEHWRTNVVVPVRAAVR
ncbi:MAG: GyrI-like domain-containing protein, partial [Amnibacterium sp.]